MAEFKPQRSDLSALPYVPNDETTRVITVRLPKSLHDELMNVADRERTSLNLLCVSKLIAQIDGCPIIPKQPAFYRTEFAMWRDTRFLVRRCRVCKCTEADCRVCIERTGEPCHWVEWDLCSACAPVAPPLRSTPSQ